MLQLKIYLHYREQFFSAEAYNQRYQQDDLLIVISKAWKIVYNISMFPYTLKRTSRSRSIRIGINSQGEVVVSAPKFVSIKEIEHFIEKSSDWIIKTQAKTNTKTKTNTETSVLVFGKEYQKKKIYASDKPIGIFIQGRDIFCNTLEPFTEEKWGTKEIKQFDRFLKNAAENYLLPRTHTLAKKMSITFNRITLREQKSRWGSCSSQGNLNFNWRLVHFSPEIIDYVIIHELAHRTHMNHSQEFWNLVATFDPEHMKHRNTLKKFSVGLD